MVFYYTPYPLSVRDKLTEEQYELAQQPGYCSHCAEALDPNQEVQEEYFFAEGGGSECVNTKKGRLCPRCFPIVVAEERGMQNPRHLFPGKAELLYTETIKREGGGNDYREHWQMV